MSKRVLITQSNYLPWKGYFDAIHLADEFIILDAVQYTRRDWRNRNRIVTPTGVRWLTIPVAVKGKFEQKINETHVSDPGWRKSHWSVIRASYSKSPFFREVAPLFEHEYLTGTESSLSRINETFIRLVNAVLGINTPIRRCEDYGVVEGKTSRLVDLCLKAGASEYLTGPSARAYLDETEFEQAGITVRWLDYSGYPPYPQHSREFEHAVSILDLLFNTGPEARQYMKSFQEI